MASFLQILPRMRGPVRSAVLWSLLLTLLSACGAEERPRLTAAGPPAAEIPRRNGPALKAGAMLASTGRQPYEGATSFRCMRHDGEGLQISFRTGDSSMPVVAVQIAHYRGSGPYRARLFVTGRSRTGALISSTGEANVQVAQQDPPQGAPTALLSGSFSGSYGGQAGKGSIEGRFDRRQCPVRGSSPPPASHAAAP
jgi:hypothetical protein